MDPGSPLRSGRGDAEGKPGGILHESQTAAAGIRTMGRLDFRADPADEIIAATGLVHDVPLLIRDRTGRSKPVPLALLPG